MDSTQLNRLVNLMALILKNSKTNKCIFKYFHKLSEKKNGQNLSVNVVTASKKTKKKEICSE
jgi:hypothetical protein